MYCSAEIRSPFLFASVFLLIRLFTICDYYSVCDNFMETEVEVLKLIKLELSIEFLCTCMLFFPVLFLILALNICESV